MRSFFYQECKRLHPLGRAGRSEEVATAIVFLASKVMMMLMMIRSTGHEKITHCVIGMAMQMWKNGGNAILCAYICKY